MRVPVQRYGLAIVTVSACVLFPEHFRYGVFVNIGAVDNHSLGSNRLVAIERQAGEMRDDFTGSVFLARRLVSENGHRWNRRLHHHTPRAPGGRYA